MIYYMTQSTPTPALLGNQKKKPRKTKQAKKAVDVPEHSNLSPRQIDELKCYLLTKPKTL